MCINLFGGMYVKKIIKFQVLLFFGVFFFISISQVQATEYQDGTYSVNYTVYENGKDSASIANDYFDKPATVIIKNNQAQIQLQLNHSDWITEFNVGNSTQIIQENPSAHTRVVQFTDKDLENKLDASIKVDIENSSLSYHHQYKIQLGLESIPQTVNKQDESMVSSKIENADQSQVQANKNNNGDAPMTTKSVENPPTGDTYSTVLYVGLSIFAIFIIMSLLIHKKLSKEVK